MSPEFTLILFEFATLVFAFSIHEASHAWMASRCGDQTARMLGRVTLNPIKHLDPLGSVILPVIAAIYHLPLIGWAKPTPITPRNLHNYKRDDILITIAGPLSNLAVAIVCLIALIVVKHTVPNGSEAISNVSGFALGNPDAVTTGRAFPLFLILFCGLLVNLSLAVFNVIPIPPLDGSRILRHFLPYNWLNMYDTVGRYSLLLLMLLGGRLMAVLYYPTLIVFLRALQNF